MVEGPRTILRQKSILQVRCLVSTPDQKDRTVAKALWEKFLIHYGIPERLHSDQCRNFELAVIKDLCQILGIKKTHTTPNHPRGNPLEWFNHTL